MSTSATPAADRVVRRLFYGALAIGVIVFLGLTVDAALLVGNFRLGQAALDQAALAAAAAVDVVTNGEQVTYELRTMDTADQASAYTLAESALAGGLPMTLTDVVSDGQRVFVRGRVESPTLFVRALGINTIPFELVGSAALGPPR